MSVYALVQTGFKLGYYFRTEVFDNIMTRQLINEISILNFYKIHI